MQNKPSNAFKVFELLQSVYFEEVARHVLIKVFKTALRTNGVSAYFALPVPSSPQNSGRYKKQVGATSPSKRPLHPLNGAPLTTFATL